jgi:sphingomyelin phosphodiesterase acid-like 3
MKNHTSISVKPLFSSLGRLCTATLVCLLLAAGNSAWAANTAGHKVLIASDIHFNPMADASLVPQLMAAEPAQWEAILNKTTPQHFSPYGQDTNWWLLQSAFDQMRKTLPRPAVFLVLGDLLAHHYRTTFQQVTHDDDSQHYRAFVLKTVQFLALQMRQRWPDTQILLTPGNNDDDCGDYSIEAGGTYLNDTAATLRDLAKADEPAVADWKALGSYSLQPAAIPGVKIVSLNSVFFSGKYEPQSLQNDCEEVQSPAPNQTFAWLERTVGVAKQANQKVWLMFHIPPGIDGFASARSHEGSCAADIIPMWAPEWTVKFNSLLINYQDTVTANFAGHTHTDDFRVVVIGNAPKAFVLVDPPISPVYNQNPAFRVIDFDGSSVRDQTTYYLTNLTTAGAKRGKWKKEYTFSREWKTKQLDSASLAKIYDGIASDEVARAHWLKLYNVSSSVAKIPPDTVRGLYCAIEGLGAGAYGNCACRPTN